MALAALFMGAVSVIASRMSLRMAARVPQRDQAPRHDRSERERLRAEFFERRRRHNARFVGAMGYALLGLAVVLLVASSIT